MFLDAEFNRYPLMFSDKIDLKDQKFSILAKRARQVEASTAVNLEDHVELILLMKECKHILSLHCFPVNLTLFY